MKLDDAGKAHAEPLAPADWALDLRLEEQLFVGVVKRGEKEMCRVSVAAEGLTESDARTRLAEMARHWIHEYLTRETTPGAPITAAAAANAANAAGS